MADTTQTSRGATEPADDRTRRPVADEGRRRGRGDGTAGRGRRRRTRTRRRRHANAAATTSRTTRRPDDAENIGDTADPDERPTRPGWAGWSRRSCSSGRSRSPRSCSRCAPPRRTARGTCAARRSRRCAPSTSPWARSRWACSASSACAIGIAAAPTYASALPPGSSRPPGTSSRRRWRARSASHCPTTAPCSRSRRRPPRRPTTRTPRPTPTPRTRTPSRTPTTRTRCPRPRPAASRSRARRPDARRRHRGDHGRGGDPGPAGGRLHRHVGDVGPDHAVPDPGGALHHGARRRDLRGDDGGRQPRKERRDADAAGAVGRRGRVLLPAVHRSTWACGGPSRSCCTGRSRRRRRAGPRATVASCASSSRSSR